METIKDVFEAFKRTLIVLYDAGETEAITLMALTELTGLSKATIKAFPERELTTPQQEQANNTLIRLKTGEPLQYITEHAEFYGLNFLVNPSVLIPRPETEELVKWAIESVSSGQWAGGSGQFKMDSGHILDIGTGSGCIAISLKKNLPDANVSAIDISSEALQTAKENAKLNAVDIDFIETDILATHHSPITPDSYRDHYSPFTLIISNPPYVTPMDKKQMHINVTDFEPHQALFVPEDDPLVFYRAIAGFAAENLKPNGLLFFEINESYGNETAELLKAMGFKNVELRKDMSDKYRMIKATAPFL